MRSFDGKQVLRDVQELDPFSLQEFSQWEDKKCGVWWDGKPVREALEILFCQIISKRNEYPVFFGIMQLPEQKG